MSIDDTQRAKELLASETFKKAVQQLDNQYIMEWKLSGPDETARRETLYHQQQALAAVVSELTNIALDEQLVDEPLEQKGD